MVGAGIGRSPSSVDLIDGMGVLATSEPLAMGPSDPMLEDGEPSVAEGMSPGAVGINPGGFEGVGSERGDADGIKTDGGAEGINAGGDCDEINPGEDCDGINPEGGDCDGINPDVGS